MARRGTGRDVSDFFVLQPGPGLGADVMAPGVSGFPWPKALYPDAASILGRLLTREARLVYTTTTIPVGNTTAEIIEVHP
jgi:hypothetical protein